MGMLCHCRLTPCYSQIRIDLFRNRLRSSPHLILYTHYTAVTNPANTSHSTNAESMLGGRRRRMANIDSALVQCFVFAGKIVSFLVYRLGCRPNTADMLCPSCGHRAFVGNTPAQRCMSTRNKCWA